MKHFLHGLTLMTVCASSAWAQDRADIDTTKIIGNRELPKVLYIVPWKKPVPSDLAGKPPASVLDEALAPIDRDVFRRQVRYDTQMQSLNHAAAPAPQSPTK
jgi:hypothetical protein